MPYPDDVAAQAALKACFGDARISPMPATWHMLVSSTPLTRNPSTGVLSGHTEPTTGGYARKAIPNTNAKWSFAVPREVSQVDAIEWAPTGSGYNVQPLYWALADAASGGNIRFWGTLPAGFQTAAGSKTIIDAGGIVISMDGD